MLLFRFIALDLYLLERPYMYLGEQNFNEYATLYKGIVAKTVRILLKQNIK